MKVSNIKYNSELYETLAEMGILCTEDKRIRDVRLATIDDVVEELPLYDTDINRIGYFNSHFMTNLGNRGEFEVWVGDDYINPKEIEWVEDVYHLYGILPRRYPETTTVKLIHNTHIAKRYSNVVDDDELHEHTMRISLAVEPFASLDHPERSVYYISENKVMIPQVVYLSDTVIEFRCPYYHNVDVFLCTNLGGIFAAKANQGVYIDNPNSHKCYHHIVVDQDPTYPIDARFYPCLKVDKDCMIRVYTDSSHTVSRPEATRLVLYPEFMDIDDPYNSDDIYLQELKPVDDVIHAADTEEEILDKLSRISQYCYRLWEGYPFWSNEMSDLIQCDNSDFACETFTVQTIHLMDGTTKEAIITRVPFEDHRDVIFYQGHMYHDYEVIRLNQSKDGIVETNNRFIGQLCYVLPADLDMDQLTILKFNAAEDTVINNIGEFIDENNMVILHSKLNRFYRNLLVLRGTVLDQYDGDSVRVSTEEPDEKDEHLWFELLTNVVPEMFETNIVSTIHAFGLDPDKIPGSIKKGAYCLNLEPDGGPDIYTEMLMTYFKLGKRQKRFLALQMDENGGVEDPRIKIFHEMYQGALPENPELNDLAIHHPEMTDTETFDQYRSGQFNPPNFGDDKVGDVFVKDLKEREIEDLLDGIGEVNADEYNLNDISYMDDETGKSISGDTIRSMTLEEKKQLVMRYITDGTPEERANIEVLWNDYLSRMNEDTLNIAVYKILLTNYVYQETAKAREELGVDGNPKTAQYVVSLDEPIDVDVGTYWLELDPDASAPMIDVAKKHNLTVIMSMGEPDLEEIGALWIHIPAFTLQDYIEDIIGTPIYENGYTLPDGYFEDTGEGYKKGAVTFDYHAHRSSETDVELFVGVHDDSLHEIHYGKLFDGTPVDGDIWYEFLDEVDNRVCYSDTESMVIRVNERLVLLQFEEDQEITAFMFDDIVMNFRGKLGIRYISILADLINSGNIDLKDVNIFYKRLITKDDRFDPALRRLYTGRSHVVSLAKIDTTDYTVAYSSNIGRFRMDYDAEETVNRERESAYRHVLDFRFRDFAFIGDRMALFVNGRYIPRTQWVEIAAEKIQLLNFPEVIACVDILYSKKDEYIIKAKKVASQHWHIKDRSASIQRPEENYGVYQPIYHQEYTYKGYYDVLLHEYILNGRLLRELEYLRSHPDEVDDFRLDMVRKFHAVSDIDITGRPDEESRIIIPCLGDASTVPYMIKEGKE